LPASREAGFCHLVVVVTAQRILDADSSVVQVVPVTSTVRGFAAEVEIDADGAERPRADLGRPVSAHPCCCCRRLEATRGNVGTAALGQIREVLGLILEVTG
jgi:mRNA interferase MazF